MMSSIAAPKAHLAPPVKKGVYSYHPDTGLAVSGVPRCPKAQLLKHLAFVDPGPALTKKGKPRVRQPPRQQDQSAEFYRAQMVHYGLAKSIDVSVTRDAAKLALSASKLKVSTATLGMESTLQALYIAENDKLCAVAAGQHSVTHPGKKSNKRQRDDGEPSTGTAGAALAGKADVKRAKKSEPEAKGDPLAKLDVICGSYSIKAKVASTLEDKTYESGFVFNLVLSSTRNHLWGAFQFGFFNGVLRARAPFKPDNDKVYFHWCGRDSEVGEAVFGPQNVGTIQFLSEGKIKGEIEGDPCGRMPVKFSGRLFPKYASTTVEDVRELKSEYKNLHAENFESDGPGRWGNSSWCGEPARRIVSDTEESADSGDEESADSDDEESADSDDEDSDGGWSDDYDGFGIRCAFDDFY